MTFQTLIRRGTRALQPAATVVSEGALYYVTDEAKIERSNGATWDAYSGAGGGGVVVQVKSVQTGALATGATQLPFDDTIPQSGEGNEYLTLAITPTSATNRLRIDVVGLWSPSVPAWITAALFQDATAAGLAAMSAYQATSGGSVHLALTHWMVAGTTAATTFKVRAGMSVPGTSTFNGVGGGRLFGGALASSITITEVTP